MIRQEVVLKKRNMIINNLSPNIYFLLKHVYFKYIVIYFDTVTITSVFFINVLLFFCYRYGIKFLCWTFIASYFKYLLFIILLVYLSLNWWQTGKNMFFFCFFFTIGRRGNKKNCLGDSWSGWNHAYQSPAILTQVRRERIQTYQNIPLFNYA